MSTSTFVEQLYTRFLSRAAEAEGKAYWVRKIDSGELNAAQVTQYFVESAEFAQIMSPVARLYFTAFGRIPDAAGLDFWAQGYRAGASLQRIAGDFVGSDEFKTLYGSAVDDGAFLDLLYQNTFNRAPDAGGKAAWLEAMAKGLSRAEVVLGFSNSEELITTKGDDVQVVVEYMGIVGGTPSQAQLDAALAGVDPVALITKLYASAAYQGEAVPFLTDSGVAVDGYVKGATVSMTISETVNGVTSTRTVTRITDEQGRFDFGDESGFGPLTMTGGTDIATGKAVNGSYTAPAGSTVVNPLTMLIQAVAASGGVSAEEAEARVKSKLGIASSVDLKRYDPVAAATAPDAGAEKVATALQVQAAAAQVNTVMGQAGALLSGAGAATSRDAGADAAVQALAKAFTADTAKVDLTAGATLAQVVKEAASGASASG